MLGIVYLFGSSLILTDICERPGFVGDSVVGCSLLEVCFDCEETLSVFSQFFNKLLSTEIREIYKG